MTENTATPAVETVAPAAPATKKAPVKKVAKKVPAVVKKVAEKAPVAAKAAKKGVAKNSALHKATFTKAQADAAGCTAVHVTVLGAIVAAGDNGASYRQIEAKTGYYANLTAICRVGKEGSLGELKYVKEEKHEGQPLSFVATAAGRKAVEKAKAAK